MSPYQKNLSMRKSFLIALGSVLTLSNGILAQADEKKFEPSGKMTGTVFANYHYDLTDNAEKKSQFELLRAYVGHLYTFSDQISSRIILDACYDGKAFTTFVKNAALEYRLNNEILIEGGMIGTHGFDTQEKFFGYRYVLETLMDRDKFISSADLGVKITYKPSEMVEFRASVANGDGYKKIQDDFGMHRSSIDVIFHPVKKITVKAYYDFLPKRDTAIKNEDFLRTQNNMSLFLGYEEPSFFRIGAEYDMQVNSENKNDQKLYGISAYGAYLINKFEFFVRFDQLMSNKTGSDADPWNFNKDHSFILGGLQLTPVKGIKLALNYRHYLPSNKDLPVNELTYLNLEYRF